MDITLVFHKLRSQATSGIIVCIIVQWIFVDFICTTSILSSGNNTVFVGFFEMEFRC